MNKDIEEAAAILAESGLVLGKETRVGNADVNLIGKVTKQSIDAKTLVEKGAEVELEVGIAYSYVADIASPAVEDPNYTVGTPVYVIVLAEDNTELLNALIDSFPYPIQSKPVAVPKGTLYMAYTNHTPETTTIDPATGEAQVVPGSSEEKNITRELEFAPITP